LWLVTGVQTCALPISEKNDLTEEPKHFHDHPEKKVGLETHLTNERVAQHDTVNFDVTAHAVWLS